jgi:hypothetical protein
MITKNKLQSIISKYYLGGKVESVKWKVKDGKLDIDFMAPTKDMIGRLSCDSFSMVNEGEMAIFNTTQLNRLLNVLAGDLMLDASKTNKVLTKLTIQDNNASINYSLADPLMIHKVGEVDENVEWKVQATLENEDFNTFVRAAASIQGNEIVTLAATRDTIDTPIIKFVFDVREDNKIPFNSEMLREIFNANKTSDECHLSFVDDGLLRLVFTAEDEGINTTYFVVRKADY